MALWQKGWWYEGERLNEVREGGGGGGGSIPYSAIDRHSVMEKSLSPFALRVIRLRLERSVRACQVWLARDCRTCCAEGGRDGRTL